MEQGLYYLNNNLCVTIPKRKIEYLYKPNLLSEFESDTEKNEVLNNLGVTEKLNALLTLINNKVIEVGGVTWDLEPTEGNTDKVLSSDVIYKVLQRYYTKLEIDLLLQNLWVRILDKIESGDLDLVRRLNAAIEEILNFIRETVDSIVDEAITESVKTKLVDLLNQIDSINAHGISVSNEFGSDSLISISLKTITDAFNKVWERLEDMSGELYRGINMTVTPKFFVSEDGCQVHIVASTTLTNGIFEHIAFYANGNLIAESENTDFFEFDTQLTETTVIKCVAKILGIEYTRQEIITHYHSFWLGAGTSYTDIMDESHIIPITNGMRGAYDVNFSDGDRMFVIVGKVLDDKYIRADMNGFEIPTTKSLVTIDGSDYYVYLSNNVYREGTYNIDING